MARIIFFIIVFFVGVFMLRQLLLRLRAGQSDTPRDVASSTEKKQTSAQSLMVPCQHCGLHVPAAEAVRIGQQYYCAEHVPPASPQSSRQRESAMTAATLAYPHPGPSGALRDDARVIALVGMAHGASHFGHLLLAVMTVYLVADFGLSFTQVGLLGTTFSVVSGVGQFFSGHAVDRYGARPLLFAALSAMLLATVLAACAQNYAMLLAVALLAGLGNAPFHPIDYSILNQRVSPPRLGHAYSVHGIGGSLGWALVPTLLLGVAHANIGGYGWRAAYALAAVFYVGVIALLWWQRQALLTTTHRSAAQPATVTASTWGFMRLPLVWWCFAFFALVTMPLSMVQYFAQNIFQIVYGLAPLQTGQMLSAYLFMLALGAVAGGFLVSHKPDRCEQILALLIALGAAFLVVLAFVPLAPSIAVALLVMTGLVIGIANPSRDMTIKRATPPGATGRVYGVVYSGLDLGMALGPVLFGFLMDHHQYRMTFASAALLLLASVFVALHIRKLGQ